METLQKDFRKLKKGELKKAITKKFRSVSRFCIIAGYHSYNDVIDELTREKDPIFRVEIFLKAKNEPDTILPNEMDVNMKNAIRVAIINHRTDKGVGFKNMKAFCAHYKIAQSWLSRLLSNQDYGAIRQSTIKMKKLLTILNLK